MKEKTGKACRELNREQLLENLNHLIGWQGLTYAELENAAGIYPGYISRMKSDPRKLPALDVIWKIAQVLGVPIEWLIEGTSGELDRESLYLRGFLQRLFDLTVEGRLSWHGTPLAQMMEVPILGLVENMAYLTCPHCGEHIEPYGPSRLAQTAEHYGLSPLGQLPMDADLARACDEGDAETRLTGGFLPDAIEAIEALG